MRDSFVRSVLELAKNDKNVELVTGDLGFGVLRPFWETVPDQFLNVGIAEQNMTAMAAGMALEGKTVFTYSIGNFPTLRCLEQIRNDCAGQGADVKIVCVGGGFAYGSLGMSHHATEDLAIMGAIPNVTVFSPADRLETAAAVRAMLETRGTCYLRLGRGGEKPVHDRLDFAVGKAIPVRAGVPERVQNPESQIRSQKTNIEVLYRQGGQSFHKGISHGVSPFNAAIAPSNSLPSWGKR